MNKKRNEEAKDIIVYALISQITNEAYIWKVKASNYYSAYKKHVNGHSLLTKELFQKSEGKKLFPKMYRLENLKITDNTATAYCVAYTKYFMEHGYQVIAYPQILSYADDPNEETTAVLNSIADVPIEEVLSDNDLLVRSYHRREKNRSPKDEIKISVSHEEYTKIQEQAKKAKMTMSRYCKNNVLKGHIISPDSLPTLPIYECMGEIREAKSILKKLLETIYRNGKHYPADLQNIQAMVERIEVQREILSREFKKYIKEIKRILPQ